MRKEALILISVLLLLPVLGLATDIVNGDMEAVSTYSTSFCAKFLIVGCQQANADMIKPDTWNTFFHTQDFGMSWHQDASGYAVHEGAWSTAIWYQPPSECGWNFSTGACGPTNQGVDGSLVQHDIIFSNSSFVISFWARKGGLPVQCDFWNCDGTQYYGDNTTTDAQFIFILRDLNTSANYTSPVMSPDDYVNWKQFTLSLSGIDTGDVFDIVLQTFTPDLRQTTANSVLFDDFEVTYASVLESPANDYISDMTTFMNFPYHFISNTSTYNAEYHQDLVNVSFSRAFDGIPLFRAWTVNSRGSTCQQSTYGIQYGYTDGTVLNWPSGASTNVSYGEVHTAPYADCYYETIYPIIGLDTLRNVTVKLEDKTWRYNFNITADMSVRQDYGNSLTGYENIYGDPDLYPVIIYQNSVNSSGCHNFNAYNFKTSETSAGNILFTLYDSDGTALDYSSGTYNFPAGASSWSNCWVSDTTDTNYIIINFTSNPALNYTSKTSTVFTLSSASAECSSGCIGTRYRTATVSGSFCSLSYSAVNDTRCYTAPVIPPASGTAFSYETPLYGDVGGLTPLTVPWVWFVLGSVIAAGAVYYYVKSEQLALATLMILMLTWLGLGILPVWLGIALVVVIVAFIAYLMRRFLPIGGGGGGGG